MKKEASLRIYDSSNCSYEQGEGQSQSPALQVTCPYSKVITLLQSITSSLYLGLKTSHKKNSSHLNEFDSIQEANNKQKQNRTS